MNDWKGDFDGHKFDIGRKMALWGGKNWDARILETQDPLHHNFD